MRGNPYVFSRFGSGVNLGAAPYSLDIGQAREALNVRTDPIGAIVKRNGCEALATPEATPHSIFGCNFATDCLIVGASTKLWKMTTGGTLTEIKTGLTNGERWEFIQAPTSGGQGPIYGVNGVDPPQQWTGAGNTAEWTASEGSIPNGKLIAYHENRVYIAKGSTLYWSDITDPRNFESPKGGSTKVDPEDGEDITAIGSIGSYLLITKERKSFVLFDTNTGGYRRISDSVGCIAPRTMVSSPIGTFFLSADNEIVVTDGQEINKEIGVPVSPLVEEVSGTMKRLGCAVFSGESVYFSLSTGGVKNDTILEFNLNTSSWWIHQIAFSKTSYAGVNQFAMLDPSDVTTLYGAGAHTTLRRIFSMFKTNRYVDMSEQAYKAYWISPWHVFTYPHLRKIIREIRVDALGTYSLYTARSFSTAYIKEEVKNWESAGVGTTFGGSGEFGGSGTFGDEAAITEKRFYTPGQGRAWSLKFESEDNQNLEIYAYTIAVQYKKD